ncbi:MAG: hypothetical protein ACLRP7_07700, partial [Christensenellales bacterium]
RLQRPRHHPGIFLIIVDGGTGNFPSKDTSPNDILLKHIVLISLPSKNAVAHNQKQTKTNKWYQTQIHSFIVGNGGIFVKKYPAIQRPFFGLCAHQKKRPDRGAFYRRL